jgi:hypothetical protein
VDGRLRVLSEAMGRKDIIFLAGRSFSLASLNDLISRLEMIIANDIQP